MSKFTISRRDLLKTSALVGGGVFLASGMGGISSLVRKVEAQALTPHDEYALARPENQLYTACLQCNTGCPVKVKILDGVAAKIDGSPVAPWAMHPHLPAKTPIDQLANIEGAICPKGQAGIQSVYDPYRIRKVLKRAGKRGENKWVSIPFDQAVREIVEGGTLFKDVAGEESRKVPGLKDVWVLKDAKVAKTLADDAAKVADKKMTLADFKAKHAANLQYLIDPEHPDLGPKNNGFTFAWGRLKGGRNEFIRRFTQALGSTNAHGHTTVCQGSLYFTGKAMSEQYKFDEKDMNYKWTGGSKFYWQADTANAEFILFIGASPLEGNYGPPVRVPELMNGTSSGRLKFAVVDPRLSKTAAKAWKWLPNKPGTEAAIAMAISRWILENKRYDVKFLANANKAAATADGEPSWCNASWLVKMTDGKPGNFVRASELGLPKEKRNVKVAGKDAEYDFDPLVVVKGGQPLPFDPQDAKNAAEGELLFDGEIKGVRVKTALQLLLEESGKNSIADWAKIAGVKAQDLMDIARELTSHGKKAVVDIHRGVSQHTNGFFNVGSCYNINLLLGNFDWKGGLIKLTTYDNAGSKQGKPFNVGTFGDGAPVAFGLSLIRHDAKYDKSTLFTGSYPARRPFFPLSSDVYQEIWGSVDDAYPYPTQILFLYMGSPVYSLPAGHKVIETLRDPKKLPLFIASDIVVGETSMFADYIFPDVSYLERWEFGGSHPSIAPKVQPIRQPVIAPLVETAKVYGQDQPISLETMILAMAEKMGLPGFGQDAFGPGLDLMHQDDMYLRQVANVAWGDKADDSDASPDADARETEVFLKSRRHLPKTAFDEARWKQIVGDKLWPKVVHTLNRGGRFQDAEKAYKGDQHANPFAAQVNMYQEKTHGVKDSMTGKNLPGLPQYIPPYQDSLGRSLMGEEKDFPFNLITYRTIQHTKSRTAGNYWVLPIEPDNGVLVSKADAAQLGLSTGDKVKLVSASNPEGTWDLGPTGKKDMIATVKVVQGMRPGVVGFSLGYGHWAYGATDVTVDGQVMKGDPRRGRGVHCNAAMRVDPQLKNTSLQDLAGGSVVFYDTRVKLVKV